MEHRNSCAWRGSLSRIANFSAALLAGRAASGDSGYRCYRAMMQERQKQFTALKPCRGVGSEPDKKSCSSIQICGAPQYIKYLGIGPMNNGLSACLARNRRNLATVTIAQVEANSRIACRSQPDACRRILQRCSHPKPCPRWCKNWREEFRYIVIDTPLRTGGCHRRCGMPPASLRTCSS